MNSRYKRDLRRIGAESAAMSAASRISCDQAKVHVESSREAITRSLEILASTAPKIAG